METQEQVKLVQKVADILNESGAHMVSEYASWFVWSSITWVIIGLVMVVFSVKFKKPDAFDDIWNMIFKAVVMVFGVLFIGVNIADLMSPEAAAIHQLINDITGR